MKQSFKHTAKAGFTLVELAIVLVIIGLIVGGVLVGQDLIKAAEMRATMADIESYNAATTTFRNKYSGLPGDLLESRASQYGLETRSGNQGQGDGNTLVEGCAAGSNDLGCETSIFWSDLTNAQLIGDAYTAATNGPETLATSGDMATVVPTTALREVSFVHVFPYRGRNYFYIGNATTNAGEIGQIDVPSGLTTSEASQMDDKADDGLPTSGIVRVVSSFTGGAMTPATAAGTATPTTGECMAEIGGQPVYNVSDEAFANELNCSLYYRTSF